MFLPDVNILVQACLTEGPQHLAARRWLSDALAGPESVGLADSIVTGTIRVLTHPRVTLSPVPLSTALGFIDDVFASPLAVSVTSGARHREVLRDVCERGDATGNLIPDAYLAALAVEHRATVVSFDRDFARFPCRWIVPGS